VIVLYLIAGLLLLVVGAERLVLGASRMALFIGISPMIIGLTVVAFGTSSPEFAVSLQAASTGNAGIVIGNVVGSNIFNVLVILGISAIILPLKVSSRMIRVEVPIMIFVSVLLYFMARSGTLTWISGMILSLGIFLYVGFQIYMGRREKQHNTGESAPQKKTALLLNIFWVILGLAFLVLGSKFLVSSAVSIAKFFGVSDLMIGLTIVAAGTSLPELVTSIVASLKGEHDIAVGNVVGSGIFNILGVLGFSLLLTPQGIPVSPEAIRFDIPVMIFVSLLCLPIFFSGRRISRPEGVVFAALYGIYLGYLIIGPR
jgi:cation:H+ antiporter